jgi:hypothetical protein
MVFCTYSIYMIHILTPPPPLRIYFPCPVVSSPESYIYTNSDLPLPPPHMVQARGHSTFCTPVY